MDNGGCEKRRAPQKKVFGSALILALKLKADYVIHGGQDRDLRRVQRLGSEAHRYCDRLLHDARGAIAMPLAMAMPVLFGFGMLLIDGGRYYSLQTSLQAGADALALAGAAELDRRSDSITRAISLGQQCDLKGRSSPPVPVTTFARFFLSEAVDKQESAFFVEPGTAAAPNVIRDSVQLVR